MTNIFRKILFGPLAVSVLVLIGGCVPDPVLMTESLQLMSDFSQKTPPGVERLESVVSPSPGDEQASDSVIITDAGWSASITVKNSRVNIRSGPGLEYQPVTTANEGTSFKTYGKTAGGWWRVCCFQGVDDKPDQPTQPAWVSGQVVEANSDAEALPLLESLFPENVDAVWDVNYQCASDRCVERVCTATIAAKERSDLDRFWLVIDREVKWADNCGQDSEWRHQLDRFDGRDLYTGQAEVFLTEYWHGANSGPSNSLFTYSDGQKVTAWCDDQLTGEVQEADGWLNTYEGVACYDPRTGILLSMNYIKRWLFSGEYAGEQYNRAYLGDFEIYEVTLNKTNIELAFQ